MEFVFAIHNELGRFLDEKIYQNELCRRCEDAGIESVASEVAIAVSHGTFTKEYYVDIVINESVPYELKTATMLTAEHRKQTLNYVLLMAVKHGKLVNMGAPSVQYEFVSTSLTPEARRQFTVDAGQWVKLSEDCEWFRETLHGLLTDWGVFLDIQLFYEAIVHFRGGEDDAIRSTKVMSDGCEIGRQKVHVLNPEIAFRLSAITSDTTFYEQHLRRLLRHTPLQAIQWVNFDQHRVVMRTIT